MVSSQPCALEPDNPQSAKEAHKEEEYVLFRSAGEGEGRAGFHRSSRSVCEVVKAEVRLRAQRWGRRDGEGGGRRRSVWGGETGSLWLCDAGCAWTRSLNLSYGPEGQVWFLNKCLIGVHWGLENAVAHYGFWKGLESLRATQGHRAAAARHGGSMSLVECKVALPAG